MLKKNYNISKDCCASQLKVDLPVYLNVLIVALGLFN